MPNYQAKRDGAYFSATTGVELSGLVAMWEARGDDSRFKRGEVVILNKLMEEDGSPNHTGR